MADDKNLKGEQDRSRVAGNEDYEIQYLARELDVAPDKVEQAIKAVGNNREKIKAYLSLH